MGLSVAVTEQSEEGFKKFDGIFVLHQAFYFNIFTFLCQWAGQTVQNMSIFVCASHILFEFGNYNVHWKANEK